MRAMRGRLSSIGRVSQAIKKQERQRTPLRALPRESANSHRTATVENGELVADLLLSPWERRFYLALRTGRSTLLQGYAADLVAAAGAGS
jgi:hypothetical protein